MARFGIWRMMAHHQAHLQQQQQHPPCDAAEIVKSSLKSGSELADPCSVTELHPKKTKNVAFSTVQVRSYELIVGDNPYCSFPLSLGWRYTESECTDLDVFESQHQPRRRQARIEDMLHVGQVLGVSAPVIDPLMATAMRPLTLYERRLMLRAQGHSEETLRNAERKRKVELALQWASGHFPKQEEFPYSQRFFLNYVL